MLFLSLKELHPNFHNIKQRGEEIYEKTLEELKSGVDYCDLTAEYVPKTTDEEKIVLQRTEQTKKKIFENIIIDLEDGLKTFPSDNFLKDLLQDLRKKTFKSFNPKKKLLDLQLRVSEHLENITADKEFTDNHPV